MACPDCRYRAALLAALAPAIERLPINRQSLLRLLALGDDELCRAAGITDAGVPRERVGEAREGVGEAQAGIAVGALSEICRHEELYPEALLQLDCAPAVLHASCDAERLSSLLATPTVAIVGDRRHTGYAKQITFALARDLASAGVTIVSGLADGIEGVAHHGALEAGGASIAVMGCAAEHPYPRQHDHLHRSIQRRGAAISEFPAGFHPPRRWCLLASQRIIAALASVVVVVEAGERSSALLAAQIGAELGGDIAAVPGRFTDHGGGGTFALLRDGAQPVACARDVLELLGGTRARGSPRAEIAA